MTNLIYCPPGTLYRQCPHCRGFIFADIVKNEGTCPKCEKPYKVEYHLSKIKLVSSLESRNFESEVLAYIEKVGTTYSVEIGIKLHIAAGTVYSIVSRLKSKELITVTPYGNKRLIELRS